MATIWSPDVCAEVAESPPATWAQLLCLKPFHAVGFEERRGEKERDPNRNRVRGDTNVINHKHDAEAGASKDAGRHGSVQIKPKWFERDPNLLNEHPTQNTLARMRFFA